ncbi:MAG: hypothetical protein QT04_C0061G0016 [archaeon GW2011_AR11]|nr:MAG: hypothetical protein QT04_C0061G0016 [archaeon GW2011_AR11]
MHSIDPQDSPAHDAKETRRADDNIQLAKGEQGKDKSGYNPQHRPHRRQEDEGAPCIGGVSPYEEHPGHHKHCAEECAAKNEGTAPLFGKVLIQICGNRPPSQQNEPGKEWPILRATLIADKNDDPIGVARRSPQASQQRRRNCDKRRRRDCGREGEERERAKDGKSNREELQHIPRHPFLPAPRKQIDCIAQHKQGSAAPQQKTKAFPALSSLRPFHEVMIEREARRHRDEEHQYPNDLQEKNGFDKITGRIRRAIIPFYIPPHKRVQQDHCYDTHPLYRVDLRESPCFHVSSAS